MKFRLQNIGIIKDTEIELNKFTVLCGKNNTGKTYITYAIYGFLKNKDVELHTVFCANPDVFENSILESDSIKGYMKNIFILSAERTAIHLFQKELDKNRNLLIDTLLRKKVLPDEISKLLEENTSRFALPVEENINFIRDLEYTEKQNSFLKKEHPELLTYVEEMLGVRYQVLDGRLVVVNPKDNTAIPSYLASTSVRSLFGLHLWLKHQVQKGDLLMIDEPEINLHPENQIKLARLLVRLVNVGVKVWITTHSDYIIKELNNLLMLSNNIENKAEVLKELNYDESEILNKEDINFYLAADGACEKIDVDEYGVLKTTFDDTIIDLNAKSNHLISLVDKVLAV